jgi:Tfp pilus assembly protein PilX
MTHIDAETRPQRRGEAGIALVLAIMALMLLTFLGLTLATTTSTELQIATNYRWSQQALYNAEAGIEAGKQMLRNIPVGVAWGTLLPSERVGLSWTTDVPDAAGMPVLPAGSAGATRNWENGGCDNRGGGVGYGAVLNDVGSPAPEGLMENRTTIFGQRLNGAVTLWVRRFFGPNPDNTGQISDGQPDVLLILTAEGVAPYTDGDTSAFARANQAVRVLEVTLLRSTVPGANPCDFYRAQVGNGPSGSNFGVCTDLEFDCGDPLADDGASLLRGRLGQVSRDAGGTGATGSGAVGTLASLQDPANPGNCVQ